MVAVSDDELLLPHLCADEGNDGGVSNPAEAVKDTVLVLNFQGVSRAGLQHGVDLSTGVAVEHEELSEVGASGAQQLQAIGFGLRQSLFVAEDYSGVVILDTPEGDEAGAGELGARAWSRKSLRIGVDGGFWLLQKNAFSAPISKVTSGAGVGIFGSGVGGMALAENDPDEIIRTCGVVTLLHL